MRIEKTSYELAQPVITSKAQISSREGWIVVLDEGELTGKGEILPLEGWSSVTIEKLTPSSYLINILRYHFWNSLMKSNQRLTLRAGILKQQK